MSECRESLDMDSVSTPYQTITIALSAAKMTWQWEWGKRNNWNFMAVTFVLSLMMVLGPLDYSCLKGLNNCWPMTLKPVWWWVWSIKELKTLLTPLRISISIFRSVLKGFITSVGFYMRRLLRACGWHRLQQSISPPINWNNWNVVWGRI